MSSIRLWLPDESGTSDVSSEIRQQFDLFLSSRPLARSTVDDYRTTARKLIVWARDRRPTGPTGFLQNLRKTDISDFLAFVRRTATGGNQERSCNKARKNLRAIFRWIEANQPESSDWRPPRLPSALPESRAAQIVTLSRKEVGRLYVAAGELRDPPSWPRASAGPFCHQVQAAIVAMVTYGLDTGTIWHTSRTTMALRWVNVFWQTTAPSKRGELPANPAGWLIYRRQKTASKLRQNRQSRMERPLTLQMAFQLRRLLDNRPLADRGDLIWRPAVGTHGQRPPEVFRRLCHIVGIDPVIDLETSQPIDWTLKHLRKTAATWHDTNIPGSASAVLGHMPENLEAVTARHYVDPAPLAAKAILSTPMPEEFPVS